MMSNSKFQNTIRKWLVLQFIAIFAFGGLTYCHALTAATLYFFGSAAEAKVQSVTLIDAGRSSGVKDTLATYVFADANHKEHYKTEIFAPAQNIIVGSKVEVLFLKQSPDISMPKFDVKILATESIPAVLLVLFVYFEATRRLFFLKISNIDSDRVE